MYKIPFNKPSRSANESNYINEALESGFLAGDGIFTKRCHTWLENTFHCKKALMTTSCTHALEMAALLAGIQPGDEVIMPSYTFVSTANAFALRGARIIFIDIRPDTMNMDETVLKAAINEHTRVIVPVHYAGVACEMDRIMEIAVRYGLLVIEDAAQGVMARYKDKFLGTIGHMGCYSFHESKNYTCGEGGALIINDESFIKKAEVIREKGTDRSSFMRGEIDKYTWRDLGSSYLPSELNSALLLAQLENAQEINNIRCRHWMQYYDTLLPLKNKGIINLPYIPDECAHNAHMFYIKVKDIRERQELTKLLKEKGIQSVFHYIPLHSSPAGQKYSQFCGDDKYTTRESERLLRLPLYVQLRTEEIALVAKTIGEFYGVKLGNGENTGLEMG